MASQLTDTRAFAQCDEAAGQGVFWRTVSRLQVTLSASQQDLTLRETHQKPGRREGLMRLTGSAAACHAVLITIQGTFVFDICKAASNEVCRSSSALSTGPGPMWFIADFRASYDQLQPLCCASHCIFRLPRLTMQDLQLCTYYFAVATHPAFNCNACRAADWAGGWLRM